MRLQRPLRPLIPLHSRPHFKARPAKRQQPNNVLFDPLAGEQGPARPDLRVDQPRAGAPEGHLASALPDNGGAAALLGSGDNVELLEEGGPRIPGGDLLDLLGDQPLRALDR
jgi:hypothetical protein